MVTISRMGVMLWLSIALINNAAAQDADRKEVDVSAKCNPFINHLTYPKDYYEGGVGIEPVVVDITGVKMISFEKATGVINLWPSEPKVKEFGADGIKGVTAIQGSKGIAGIRHDQKAGFLMGVFSSSSITPEERVEDYVFTGNENYTVWGFELEQPFFIGDGLTDKGAVQQILVPSGADKLYLGFADGGIGMARGYDENIGSIHTTIVMYKKIPLGSEKPANKK